MLKFYKSPLLLVCLLLFVNPLVGLAQTQNQYDIKISIKNLQDKSLSFGYHFGDKQYVLDSAKVGSDGFFHFRKDKKIENGIYFFYSPSMYMEIVLGDNERKMSFITDTIDYVKNLKVIGSKENKYFIAYQKFLAEKREEAKDINSRLSKFKNSNSTEHGNLQLELNKISKDVKGYQDSIISNYPQFMTAKILRVNASLEIPAFKEATNSKLKRYNYYKDHYFDNIDFSDPSLLRTPILWSKVNQYLEKVVPQHPDSISNRAKFLIEKTRVNEDCFKYFLNSITSKYENSEIMGMENVFVSLAEAYYLTGEATWLTQDLKEKISKRVSEMKPNLIGENAPVLHLVDSSLIEPVYLENINSPYVILYFYDPDCGHCKKETPKLKKAYESDLAQFGVEVLAIPTITDHKRWKKYMQNNKLPWMHAADPFVRSNFRAEYDLKTTPQIFILDSNKKIIAKKLSADQVSSFVTNYTKLQGR